MDKDAKPQINPAASTQDVLAALESIPALGTAHIRVCYDDAENHILGSAEGLRLFASYALRAALLPAGKLDQAQEPKSSCSVHVPSAITLGEVLRFSVGDDLPGIKDSPEVLTQSPVSGILLGSVLFLPWIIGAIWLITQICAAIASLF